LLSALLAEGRGEREEALALVREAWDETEWDLTLERLRQVGLGELEAEMVALRQLAGIDSATAGPAA
jgi:hypothetical protein